MTPQVVRSRMLKQELIPDVTWFRAGFSLDHLGGKGSSSRVGDGKCVALQCLAYLGMVNNGSGESEHCRIFLSRNACSVTQN